MSATWSDHYAEHIRAALPDRTVTARAGHTFINRAMAEARVELLTLAEGIDAGKVRRDFADEIVPLTVHPQCYQPWALFDALVEAVHDKATVETQRLLDCLTRERAA